MIFHQDFVARVLLTLTAVATVAIVIGGGWLIANARVQSDDLAAQTMSDAVTACRSEYAVVETDAQQAVDRAESARDDLLFLGLAAVAAGDDLALISRVADAEEVVGDIAAARRRLDEETSRRSEAVSLSRQDPERFLEGCERDFG